MKMEEIKKSPLPLIPFIVFFVLYLSVGSYLAFKGTDFAFYQFPASSCALVAFIVALLIHGRKIREQIETFLDGIRDKNVVVMLLIFLLAGAFVAIMKKMGGVESTVNIGLSFIPTNMILPGLFLISCIISLAMGTSMGTISAVAPIAVGFSEAAGLSMPLAMGAVLGGAMFGDNLSIISDTTIAATSTQGCDMRSKFRMNLKIVLPAAILVFILLFFSGNPQVAAKDYPFTFVKTIPYIVVLITALAGTNVIVVLLLGIVLSTVIGFATGSLAFLEFGKAINDGFMSMTEVIFLTFFVAGLAAIAAEEGGLEYILDKLSHLIVGKRSAKVGIAGLVSVADICTANNTVAIILTGKMAKQIGDRYEISAPRSASLLDIFSSAWQGLLPYGAQLLLLGSLSKLSPFSIIPYSWYPILLGISGLIAIIFNLPRKQS